MTTDDGRNDGRDDGRAGFDLDGRRIPFTPGQSVGAALWAAGAPSWRTTRFGGRPRGLFCGIGVCFDCLVRIDGRTDERACLIPARPGMRVRSSAWGPLKGEGWGLPEGEAGDERPARPARASADVLVVGAGPAGLAAAVAAWRAGAQVVLLDAQDEPGGQYWRHPPGAGPDRHHDPDGHVRLTAALAAGVARGGIDHRRGHQVWRVVAHEDGHAVHAVHAAGPGRAEAEVEVIGRALVLATGAYERALPFPGWDIPGVLTAGAAQALLAEHGVPAGRRVVVGGTGPFLLPVAAGLAEAGARVVGLFEAGDPRAWLARWRDVAARPSAIGEGAGYLARLAWYGIRVVPRTAVVAAHGDERVEGVTVARLDAGWRAVPGSARRLDCDAVAVGWGFTPRIELAVQAGCATRPGPDGAPLVDVDDVGASSVPGVYAAGEITGVAGAPLAVVEGEAAGAAAAAHAGGRGAPESTPSRAGLVRFAAAMHAAHPVRDGWVTWLRPDTTVCRCEEVPLARVEEAISELGAADARTVKLLTRCGMGWCQGRICGEAVARLVDARAGRPDGAGGPAANLRSFADRPLATPVRLDTLADLEAHEDPARDREPL